MHCQPFIPKIGKIQPKISKREDHGILVKVDNLPKGGGGNGEGTEQAIHTLITVAFLHASLHLSTLEIGNDKKGGKN